MAMKVFLVPPPELPVPAVKGGAVETLLEHLIFENEKQGKLELYCASIPDPDISSCLPRLRPSMTWIGARMTNLVPWEYCRVQASTSSVVWRFTSCPLIGE